MNLLVLLSYKKNSLNDLNNFNKINILMVGYFSPGSRNAADDIWINAAVLSLYSEGNSFKFSLEILSSPIITVKNVTLKVNPQNHKANKTAL